MNRPVVTLLLMTLIAVHAQSPTATLIGVIHHPAGLSVVNASVVVRNTNTGTENRTRTSAGGTFTMPNLNAGPYEVTVEKEGFQTLHETGIKLQIQQ